jgi:hypothetical protein
MHKLTVVSMRGGHNKPNGKSIIRIDRKTIFGNPVKVGQSCVICGKVHPTNSSVLPCYRVYLWKRMNEDVDFLASLTELALSPDVKALACWCKPDACHGDILVNAIEWIRNKELK